MYNTGATNGLGASAGVGAGRAYGDGFVRGRSAGIGGHARAKVTELEERSASAPQVNRRGGAV
eukprot:2971365-Pleurochrysis_carterae.AAC.1